MNPLFVDTHKTSATMENYSQAFRLLDFPLELREKIYWHYLIDYSTLEDWREAKKSSIQRVSKQVSGEVLDVFRRHGEFTYRITHWNATFNGLTLACFQKLGKDIDYSAIKYLKVEIYPYEYGCMSDMIEIIRYVQKLCAKLRSISNLKRLSLRFIEPRGGRWKWSDDGNPTASLPVASPTREDISDVEHCLECFGTLTNVGKVSVDLPRSCHDDRDLQEIKKDLEIMMTPQAQWHMDKCMEVLEEAIRYAEILLKNAEDYGVAENHARRWYFADAGVWGQRHVSSSKYGSRISSVRGFKYFGPLDG